MEDYFRTLIEKCKEGQLSANDIVDRVAKLSFSTSTTTIAEPKKPKPLTIITKEKAPQQTNLRLSLLSVSTKQNDYIETMATEFEAASVTPEGEEKESNCIWNTIFNQHIQKRRELWEKYEDCELQDYIDNQLTRLFDNNPRTITNKEQLEDIKRKCRLKWFIRMKRIRDAKRLKDDEEFRENCSFHPKINESRARPKYLEIQTKPAHYYMVPEYPFSPTINRNSNIMVSRSIERAQSPTYASLANHISPTKNGFISYNDRENMKRAGLTASAAQLQVKSDLEAGSSVNEKKVVYVDDDLNELIGCLAASSNFSGEELNTPMHPKSMKFPDEEVKVAKTLRFTEFQRKVHLNNQKQGLSKKPSLLEKDGVRTPVSTKSGNGRFTYRENSLPNDKRCEVGVVQTTKAGAGMRKVSSAVENSINSVNNVKQPASSRIEYEEKGTKKGSRFPSCSSEKNVLKQFDNRNYEEAVMREERLNERKMKKLSQIDKENQEKYTFKPQISKTAQALDPKVHEEKVVNFVRKKEEKLMMLRAEKARKELDGVTHQPKINERVGASSKLGINLSTKDYINFLKDRDEIEKQYIELERKRKEAIEKIECTYTPQISIMPSSVKNEFTSPKLSIHSSQSSNYSGIHQRKKQNPAQSIKLTSWNCMQKDNIYIPPLFDDISHHEISFYATEDREFFQ